MKQLQLIGIIAITIMCILLGASFIFFFDIEKVDYDLGNDSTENGVLNGFTCEVDDDCDLPMEYAIRSSCPFDTKCVEGECRVVCPFDEEEKYYPINESWIN